MSKASPKKPAKSSSAYSQLSLFGNDDIDADVPSTPVQVQPAVETFGADSTSLDEANYELHYMRVDAAHATKLIADSFEGSDALASRLVRASAGTGKTYRLTARLLRILLQGAPPESILATTFTRKAAGEILTKLLDVLANASDESNPQALEALREQVQIKSLPRTVCVQLLDNLLRNIHRIRICTLDSLFTQLAKSFPFELGLPASWRLTDEIEEVWLRERAVDAVVATVDPGELMSLLAMLSKGDVKRSVAFEILQVINTAYTAQRQCDDSVWHKLQAPKGPNSLELADLVDELRAANPKQARVAKKLDALAETVDLNACRTLERDTFIGNIAKARRNKAEVKFGQSKLDPDLNAALDVLYSAVRSETLGLLQAQNAATGTIVEVYENHINSLKFRSRSLGFDDVAVRLAEFFRNVDQETLELRMDGAIDHVLLDEFQDTSPIQWQVLRPLAMHAAATGNSLGRGREWQVARSFFCVGDTKQAIYGWRGGVAEIFDAVSDQIDDIETEKLNTSFRSSPVVLNAVDQVFMNVHHHPLASVGSPPDLTDKYTYAGQAITKFARNFPHHQAAPKNQNLPGFVRYQTCRKIDGSEPEKRMACLDDVCEQIAKLHKEAPKKTIGVLTRTNETVARLIFQLDGLGVDVSQEGGNPLVDSAAVELILSTLMACEHPGDGRWMFHVQDSPIGKELGDQLPFTVRSMVEEIGLVEAIEYLAGLLAEQCDERDTFRMKQLLQLALNYQNNAAPRLRDFVRLVREKRIERPKAAAVRVMTIHQSKGLEFDAVFLPELDGQLTRSVGGCVTDVPNIGEPPVAISRSIRRESWHFLPESWQRAFGANVASEMTESLCLLYVAMTRAKQALYMMTPPVTKSDFDRKTPASLMFHALNCQADPTAGETLLFSDGDAVWHRDSDVTKKEDPHIQTRKATRIQFRTAD